MFWNKKSKESSLPDLPPPSFPIVRSELPPIHSTNQTYEKEENIEESKFVEKHNLPSFPDSPLKKGFSQTAIKNAIDSEEEKESEEEFMQSPSKGKLFKTVEVDSETPIISKKLPLPPERKESKVTENNYVSLDSKTKEVFVKIDKFQSARKSLSLAKEKVEEIESMLKKIRDIRMREDQELTAWERDIESVKSRIEDISKNIFEKL
jgi:hypothetical protein